MNRAISGSSPKSLLESRARVTSPLEPGDARPTRYCITAILQAKIIRRASSRS